jgi:CBS domain-containing protein
MSQQRPPEDRGGAVGAGRGASQFIEKGWSVYDAAEHPLGNVTEIDIARDVLDVDGRPQGFGTFEIPLSMVESAGSNEVHLAKVLDASAIGSGGSPRFVDPPAITTGATTTTSTTTRSRTRNRAEPASTTGSASTRSRTSGATTDPVGPGTMREFSPPYASRHPTMGPEGETPSWGHEHEDGWSAKKIAMAGLALGGLAGATYFMRRRMRRKTAFERFMDVAGDYVDVTSEFARNRHPAWWASLAAAALPLAYYAWPSPKPTYTEQARGRAGDFTSYLAGLAGTVPRMPGSRPSMTERMWSQMPSMADFEMPSNWQMPMPAMWRKSDRASSWDWSPRPDVAGTLGALAAGALTVYLIRRAISKPAPTTRIADVMTRQPRVIQPDATVADAAAMMRRLDVGAIPVCDGTRLIGMLTDRDITIRSTADGRDPHLTPVRDVMSLGVAWATEDDPVGEAARIMREHRIRRLPIVDERHSLVGVVSLGDLAVDVRDDDLSGDTLERISEKTQAPREF